MRRGCLLALAITLTGCASESTAVTRRAAVLGYPGPPAIAVIARGERDLVDPFAASLRSAGTARVVVELAQSESPLAMSNAEVCRAVEAAGVASPSLDEILLINTYLWSVIDDKCIDEECNWGPVFAKNDPLVRDCSCVKWRYKGVSARVETTVTALRASTCEILRTDKLPDGHGASTPRDAIEYKGGDPAADDVRAARSYDATEARAAAVISVATFAPHVVWGGFPRSSPILSADLPSVVVGTPLATGKAYYLKEAMHSELRPGVRAVRSDATTTTFELDPQLPKPQAGDELHVKTDMRRASLYGAVGAGSVRAQDSTHGLASAALAVRWAFDKLPLMLEAQLAGELLPGLDAQRVTLGGAVGFRVPFEPISPVIFGELGLGKAYQGLLGAERAYAVGGHAGLGIGGELWLSHWFVFADVRRRWFVMDDWKDGSGKVVGVKYPDLSWSSTTGQVGAGRRF